MAAQGKISEAYGTDTTGSYSGPTAITASSNPKLEDVLELAGIADTRVTAIGSITYDGTDKYKIVGMEITFSSGKMTLSGGTWTKG